MLRCSKCGEVKPETEFNTRKEGTRGFHSNCRSCIRVGSYVWRRENPGKVRESTRRYRASKPETHRAEVSRYQNKNPVKVREWKRRWDRANPHIVNAKTARRAAAKLRATPAWADKDDITQFYEVAAVLSRSGVRFDVDHIVPLRGKTVSGLHVESNLQVLPSYLNSSKGNRHWPDMP